MSVALLLGLLIQTTAPDASTIVQSQTATVQETTETTDEVPPARELRNRARNETASECQFRARTGSIRRRNICYTPRQLAAHNAVARRYVEEIQVGQSSDELPGGGPD